MLKSIRMLFVLGLVFTLVGCVTVTGVPREDYVIYQDTSPVSASSPMRNSISVGEVSDFVGTSIVTLTLKTNPNLDNEEFSYYLEKSLENAELLGNDGYTLHAKLIEDNSWSLWGHAMGEKNRDLDVEYTLVDKVGTVVFNKVISGDGSIRNLNPLEPFHMTERKAAEKGYRNNIANLIEELKTLEL